MAAAYLWANRFADTLRHRIDRAMLAFRLAFHASLGVRMLPDGAARLRRARRARAFHRLRAALATGSPFDLAVLSSMTNDDEYGIVERTFEADDVILDVGAHIGAFSLLCHDRGSRALFAFEPNPDTFALLEENVGSLRGVSVDRRAVFRSDVPARSMRLSPIADENTGSPTLLFDGFPFEDPRDPELLATARDVPTVPLDSLLEKFERVTLLKLDCEGGEFPILLTSRELGRVQEIVGEYHELDAGGMSRLAPLARLDGVTSYRRERLVEHLVSLGFEVAFSSTSDTPGIFRAVRRKPAASARE